jgi:hypothetical protein
VTRRGPKGVPPWTLAKLETFYQHCRSKQYPDAPEMTTREYAYFTAAMVKTYFVDGEAWMFQTARVVLEQWAQAWGDPVKERALKASDFRIL